jgi:4-carboxymuconolactone decarboxylase
MSDLFERGLQIRRDVVGADYVDRSLAQASPFARPMQELVTEFCWGAVWARDDLQRRDRSLVNLGMIAALGKQHELAVHVRGAITNGLTVEEIRGVLLQVAVYCGMPTGLEALRTAETTLRDLGLLDE